MTQPTTQQVTRPAIRYYGGKWNLAEWILSYFPPHQQYVELCGGAGSVLLQKPRSDLEIYNDLDNNVVNFFQMLRDRPEELINKIWLTPWARAEYELHRVPDPDPDPLEKARRFWVGCCMSISGSPFTSSGMRLVKSVEHAPNGVRSWFYEKLDHLYAAAERFRMVQIENKPYQDILSSYDHPETLFYFDPPYVTSTRTNGKEYLHEWTDNDHREAAELLQRVQGYVVVSGYPSPLYAEIYTGWHRTDREAAVNAGSKRVECLWLSPRTTEALANQAAQTEQARLSLDTLPLFAGMETL